MDKICSTCGVNKKLSEFHRDVTKKDGHRNNCKQCSKVNKNYNQHLSRVIEKTCNKCKLIKPLEQFIKDNRRPLGHGMQCLECSRRKLCRGCNVVKNVSEFSTSSRSADGYGYQCKVCTNEKKRLRYAHTEKDVNQERGARYRYKKETREGSRERMLLREYNLTLDEYEEMLKSQQYRCKICKSKEGERGRSVLAVDHDHKTGIIRGLLCDPCNRALGMFLDNPDLLRSAIDYLENPGMMFSHFG